MKINAKYFNLITSEPKVVHDVENGIVEIHSLNEFPSLYNVYIQKGKFTCWVNNGTKQDGKDLYKLLIEDSFYTELKDLYGKRVNNAWIGYYNDLDFSGKKFMKCVFVPVSIVVLLGFGAVTFFVPAEQSNLQMILGGSMVAIFFIVNVIMHKKRNKSFVDKNREVIENIKNILGHEKFNATLDKQEAFMDEFYKKQREALGIYDDEVADVEQIEEKVEEEVNE